MSSFTSGNPEIEVSIDKMPESSDAETTATQFTSFIIAVTPMVETAVCAMVFTALTVAHFSHC